MNTNTSYKIYRTNNREGRTLWGSAKKEETVVRIINDLRYAHGMDGLAVDKATGAEYTVVNDQLVVA